MPQDGQQWRAQQHAICDREAQEEMRDNDVSANGANERVEDAGHELSGEASVQMVVDLSEGDNEDEGQGSEDRTHHSTS